MNLNQGAVSKAILEAAGPGLQQAVRTEASSATLQYTDVIITDGFKLKCQKVFHAVCPFWDNGTGQAEEVRVSFKDENTFVIMTLYFGQLCNT